MTNRARPTWPSASKRCCSTHLTCRQLYSSHNRLHWTCWSASCFWIRRNLNSARAVSRRSSASLEESGSETIPFKIRWIERKWLWELKNQKRLELTHSPVCSIRSNILSMSGGGHLDGQPEDLMDTCWRWECNHWLSTCIISLHLCDFASEFLSSIVSPHAKSKEDPFACTEDFVLPQMWEEIWKWDPCAPAHESTIFCLQYIPKRHLSSHRFATAFVSGDS